MLIRFPFKIIIDFIGLYVRSCFNISFTITCKHVYIKHLKHNTLYFFDKLGECWKLNRDANPIFPPASNTLLEKIWNENLDLSLHFSRTTLILPIWRMGAHGCLADGHSTGALTNWIPARTSCKEYAESVRCQSVVTMNSLLLPDYLIAGYL